MTVTLIGGIYHDRKIKKENGALDLIDLINTLDDNDLIEYDGVMFSPVIFEDDYELWLFNEWS